MATPIPSTSQLPASSIPASAFDSQVTKAGRPKSAKARGKAPAGKVSQAALQAREVEQDLYDLAPERVKRRSKAATKEGKKGRKGKGKAGGGEGGEGQDGGPSEAGARTSTKPTKPKRTISTASTDNNNRRRNHPRPSSPSSHHSDPGSDHSPPSPRLGPTPPFPQSLLPELDPSAVDPADWADPRNLPQPVTLQGRQHRRPDEWRALELGGYRVALHDVATDQLADLGRTLVEWEGIARWRRRVEEEKEAAQDTEEAGNDGEGPQEYIVEDTPPPTSSQPLTQPPPAQVQPLNSSQPARTPHSSAEDGEDDTIPLPTSIFLLQMSRWPIHPSALYGPPPFTRQRQKPFELSRFSRSEADDAPPPLAESITYLIQREARKLRRRLPPRPRAHAVATARSAYAANGPLFDDAADSDASAQSDGAESDDEGHLSSHSLDSQLDEDEAEVREAMEARAGEVLAGLTGLVPKGPMPALDYWTRKARGEAAEPSRREVGVGWEGVLSVVKGMEGLPEQVVAKLEARLKAVYQPPPTLAPPIPAPADVIDELIEPVSTANGHPASMPSSPLPPFKILPPTDDDDSDRTAPRPASPAPEPRVWPLPSPLPTPPATAELAAAVKGGPSASGGAAAPLAVPGLGLEEGSRQAKRAGEAEEAGRKAKKARVDGKGGKEKEKERRAKAVKRRSLGAGFR